jgi:GntR family transcriptional repressor for pyruvate dehydrogenase complex
MFLLWSAFLTLRGKGSGTGDVGKGADVSAAKSTQAIEMVKQMIIRGDLRPGDRLPNEEEFALRLGISRNSMREAVRALSVMQVLVTRQGDGTYVSSLEPHLLLETLSFAVDIAGPQAVLQFLEVRRVLESHAATIAAAKRTDADLRRLRAIHTESLAVQDPDILIVLDMRLHSEIADISGNSILSSLLNVVSSPTIRARIWRARSPDFDPAIRVTEHDRILEAIERQDAGTAHVESWNHVMGVERWVRANWAIDAGIAA